MFLPLSLSLSFFRKRELCQWNLALANSVSQNIPTSLVNEFVVVRRLLQRWRFTEMISPYTDASMLFNYFGKFRSTWSHRLKRVFWFVFKPFGRSIDEGLATTYGEIKNLNLKWKLFCLLLRVGRILYISIQIKIILFIVTYRENSILHFHNSCPVKMFWKLKVVTIFSPSNLKKALKHYVSHELSRDVLPLESTNNILESQ